MPDGIPPPVVPNPVTDYVPSAWPGVRAPHVWMRSKGEQRVSSIDLVGKGFVLHYTPHAIEACRTDRYGLIHARHMHSSFYDPELMRPSRIGIEYLLPIFTDAIGNDDMEHLRQTLFAGANLTQPYHSVNTDVNKRIRYLDELRK